VLRGLTVGFGGDPALRAGFGSAGSQFGTLVHVAASGHWETIADVSAYEATPNPDGFLVDSNPYGVFAAPGARIVADAGANALLQVKANGDVSTLAVFPAGPGRSTDSVATAVAIGPDGAIYVSNGGISIGTGEVLKIEP